MTKPHAIDCKGLACPLPIVRISQAIKSLATGDLLVVEATDPAFFADLRAWTKRLGHELLTFEVGECQRATIRKS
ncbi:MAG: sulfurtransferase TusA family protein [Myxococcales bacterium]|nr:sulfurtransferase TusA family protein [Myxococcales bacterium]